MPGEKITVESVETKLKNKQELTAEESQFVMGLPPDESAADTGQADDTVDWEGAEHADGIPPGQKKDVPAPTPEQQAAAALSARAKAAGLKETATEVEVTAAETAQQAAADEKDPLVKLERKFQETEGLKDAQIDLSKEGWSEREKAYFWQMRRDRKLRQQAEQERDAALFEKAKAKLAKPADAPAAPVKKSALDELKSRDKTDYITVEEALAVADAAKTEAAPVPETPAAAAATGPSPVYRNYLKLCDEAAQRAHQDDYEAVMELSPEIIETNPDHLAKISDAVRAGQNPAEVTYQLIKGDPEFAKLFPVAQTKVAARKKKPEGPTKTPEELEKERKAREAQAKLESTKTKTSAHATSSEGDAADKIDEYTLQQIVAMSDLQFAKLPKKTRDAFLKKYGQG